MNQSAHVPLPLGIPTVRSRPRPLVEVPANLTDIPLIDSKTPDAGKIQEVMTAHVKVFDLSDEEDLKQYVAVWQEITNGQAQPSEQRTEFVPSTGKFVALLRWSSLSYKVPIAQR